MTRLVKFDVNEDGGVVMTRIVGEIDASNVGQLFEGMMSAVSNQSHGLVADLTETSYLDSAGVKLLFDAAERLRSRQIEFRLVAPVESFVMDVLAVTQVPDTVSVHETVDDALAGLDAG